MARHEFVVPGVTEQRGNEHRFLPVGKGETGLSKVVTDSQGKGMSRPR